VPPGRLVDRPRTPSGVQVPPRRLVDRARPPSRFQVPPRRLVDSTLQGRKEEHKGRTGHSAKGIVGAPRGKEWGQALGRLAAARPPTPKIQLRAL